MFLIYCIYTYLCGRGLRHKRRWSLITLPWGALDIWVCWRGWGALYWAGCPAPKEKNQRGILTFSVWIGRQVWTDAVKRQKFAYGRPRGRVSQQVPHPMRCKKKRKTTCRETNWLYDFSLAWGNVFLLLSQSNFSEVSDVFEMQWHSFPTACWYECRQQNLVYL